VALVFVGRRAYLISTKLLLNKTLFIELVSLLLSHSLLPLVRSSLFLSFLHFLFFCLQLESRIYRVFPMHVMHPLHHRYAFACAADPRLSPLLFHSISIDGYPLFANREPHI
jgi:hypothetical protein